MKKAIIYYEGDQASFSKIINEFKFGAKSIALIKFDKKEFDEWKGDKEDTYELRQLWANEKLKTLKRAPNKKTMILCDSCKKWVPKDREDAKYCSNACRQRAKNERAKMKKEEEKCQSESPSSPLA